MRRYACTVYDVVCLSHASIVSKWLNLGSYKQCPGTLGTLPKILVKLVASPPMGAQNASRVD